MKLKIYRPMTFDPLVLEFGHGNSVYIRVIDDEGETLGEIGIDRYGQQLRVHVWDHENYDEGDPTQTTRMAYLDHKNRRSILDVAKKENTCC